MISRTINIKVFPRSSREKVEETEGGGYKVYTFKAAADGEANRAVIDLLAGYFGVKRGHITMIKGERSRDKVIRINVMNTGGR